MIGPWMLYAIGVGAALGVAALLAERVLQLLALPRRGAWAVAIGASVGLPAALSVRSALTRIPEPLPVGLGEPLSVVGFSAGVGQPVPGGEVGAWGVWLDAVLGWGWVMASVLLLVVLVFSFVSLGRMKRSWRGARVAGSAVLVSRSAGPAVVGCFRTSIVLPEWALDWEAGRQRMIVEHERAHARARDPLLMLGALMALVVMPWNLPLWWQVHRLRLAVEMDCDRRVLRRLGDVHGYGMLLLEVSGRSNRSWLPVAAFSEPASFLERRIRGITAVRPRRWVVRALAAGFLVVALPVGVIAIRPAEPPFADRLTAGLSAGPAARQAAPSGAEWEFIEYFPEPAPRAEVPEARSAAAALAQGQDTSRIYDVSDNALTRRPRLSNTATLASEMERLYSRILRDAGIQGTVIVEFVIERDGTVNPASVQVIEAPHEALVSATRQALEAFRFSPAQVNGVDVRTRTRMPITWMPRGGQAGGGVPVQPAAAPGGDAPPVQVRPGTPVVLQGTSTGYSLDGQGRTRAVDVDPMLFQAAIDAAALADYPTQAAPRRDTIPNVTYEVSVLSRPPRLNNAAEVAAAMNQLYPSELRAAGIVGTVVMQFVIGADGRVEPRSVQVFSSAHAGLDEPTIRLMERMRFSPGQYEGRDVRVLTQMPINWQP